MNAWKAWLNAVLWLTALVGGIWGGLQNSPFALLLWPAVLWPLLMLTNWGLTYLCLRRFGKGLAAGGVRSEMELHWGFIRMRGGVFRSRAGPIHLQVGRWGRRVGLPGAAGPETVPFPIGYESAGRQVAARVQRQGVAQPARKQAP